MADRAAPSELLARCRAGPTTQAAHHFPNQLSGVVANHDGNHEGDGRVEPVGALGGEDDCPADSDPGGGCRVGQGVKLSRTKF